MITVYTKNNCAYCVQAKQLLNSMSIPYDTINIEETPGSRDFLVSEGHRTMPQIYFGKQLFVEGGYQGLSKLTKEEIVAKINELEKTGTL